MPQPTECMQPFFKDRRGIFHLKWRSSAGFDDTPSQRDAAPQQFLGEIRIDGSEIGRRRHQTVWRTSGKSRHMQAQRGEADTQMTIRHPRQKTGGIHAACKGP